MADERYQWLDVDAAEKLLRGDFVEPVDDHARAGAQRLAAALGEARAVHPATGELPGEARVLAAFREASRARREDTADRRTAATGRGAKAGRAGTLLTVRVGAGHTAPPRRPRWSRPLRYGLVASLAGCALGGVAVAASTGMISGPFGGHGSPVPAASVSAAASPEELGSVLPSRDPSASPPGSPASSGSAAPSKDTTDDAESATDGGGAVPSGPPGGPTRTETAGQDGNADGDGSKGATGGQAVPEGPTDAESRALYEKTVRECRDYRDGTLDKRSKRRLIRLAKGEDNLDRFCDRLLDKAGQNGDGGAGDDSGGNDGGGGDDGDTGDGSGGSLPSVSFDRSPTAVAPSGDAARAAGEDATSPAASASASVSASASSAPAQSVR